MYKYLNRRHFNLGEQERSIEPSSSSEMEVEVEVVALDFWGTSRYSITSPNPLTVYNEYWTPWSL